MDGDTTEILYIVISARDLTQLQISTGLVLIGEDSQKRFICVCRYGEGCHKTNASYHALQYFYTHAYVLRD